MDLKSFVMLPYFYCIVNSYVKTIICSIETIYGIFIGV